MAGSNRKRKKATRGNARAASEADDGPLVRTSVRFPDEVLDEADAFIAEAGIGKRSELLRLAATYGLAQFRRDPSLVSEAAKLANKNKQGD